MSRAAQGRRRSRPQPPPPSYYLDTSDPPPMTELEHAANVTQAIAASFKTSRGLKTSEVLVPVIVFVISLAALYVGIDPAPVIGLALSLIAPVVTSRTVTKSNEAAAIAKTCVAMFRSSEPSKEMDEPEDEEESKAIVVAPKNSAL